MTFGIIVVSSLLVSLFATGLWRVVLVRHAVLDHANARSSHTGSIPRGGGVVFCALTLSYTATSLAMGWGDPRSAMVLLVGGGLVATVGFIDDLNPLPAVVRLLIHAIAAIVLVAGLSPLPQSIAGIPVVVPAWIIQILLAIAVMWSINLWNFMDGIDGLAGSQAVIVLAGLTIVASCSGSNGTLPAVMTGLVGGFLAWNLSSCRLFMGDAGSGFLGFAVLLMIAGQWSLGDIPIWSGVLATAMMWTDASVTLVCRTMRKQRPWVAHRSHVYQHLVQGDWSHRQVTAIYGAIQILVLCPLALAAMHFPWSGPWLTAGVILVLTPVAISLGGGVEASQAES
ncbi:MAG: glycosyltransferase family 4 protein [Actinomycetales bacterium]|nr:glycosyltransferase family 4 protein [Actinomycetales bacterium]